MKAYCLSIKDEDDAGAVIVFADNVKMAKKQYSAYDNLVDALEGGWIALQAHRDKRYDGMEKLSAAELAMHQWRDGWRWFDTEYPDPDNATDAEFLEWYKNEFGDRKTI